MRLTDPQPAVNPLRLSRPSRRRSSRLGHPRPRLVPRVRPNAFLHSPLNDWYRQQFIVHPCVQHESNGLVVIWCASHNGAVDAVNVVRRGSLVADNVTASTDARFLVSAIDICIYAGLTEPWTLTFGPHIDFIWTGDSRSEICG